MSPGTASVATMLQTVAIRGYRSLRELVVPLRRLTVVTGANGTDLVAFGTEAGLFQSLGADVIVCGPGSIEQAHQPDEWIALEQLEKGAAFMARLAEKLN